MKIGNREFVFGKHTYIMGILNITPDSFSDGGKWNRPETALRHVEQMIKDGMDVVDVGGESTRPGYRMISEEEEIDRTAPIIEKIKSEFNIPVSLDTYKSKVAEAGLKAGADLINDIWGLKFDDRMGKVIADSGCACCLMHNRKEPVYNDFLQEVKVDLEETISLAKKAGIDEDRMILDPGVGFGKSYENNLEVLRNLNKFHVFHYPLLLGCSRKSVIGLTLNLNTDERVEGTLVTTVMATLAHYGFVRVHDVKENFRAIKMTEAIMSQKQEESDGLQ